MPEYKSDRNYKMKQVFVFCFLLFVFLAVFFKFQMEVFHVSAGIYGSSLFKVYYMFFAVFTVGICFIRKSVKYLPGIFLIFIGWYISSQEFQSLEAFIYYAFGGLAVVVAYVLGERARALNEAYEKNGIIILMFAAIFLGTIFCVFPGFIDGVFWERLGYTTNHRFLIVMPVDLMVFTEKLLIAGIFLITAVVIAMLVYGSVIRGVFLHILFLFIFTLGAKFIFMYIKPFDGFAHLAATIDNVAACNFYTHALTIDSVVEFIKKFTSHYQSGIMGYAVHVKSHPVFATLIYKFLIDIVGENPFRVGVGLSILSAFAVIPVYLTTNLLSGSKKTAFAAGMLFAFSGISGLLSSIPIEGISMMLFAFSVYFVVAGVEKKNNNYFALAGIFFSFNTLVNFGIWPALLFIFGFLLKSFDYKKLELWKSLSIRVVIISLGILSCHIFLHLIAGENYNYFAAFEQARHAIRDTMDYPYAVWWWLNIVHWVYFASVPVFIFFVFRYVMVILRNERIDMFALLTLLLWLIYMFSAMGRIQQVRQYMFLIVPVVIVAAMAVPKKICGRSRESNERDPVLFNVAAILVFLNTLIYAGFIEQSYIE